MTKLFILFLVVGIAAAALVWLSSGEPREPFALIDLVETKISLSI